MCGAMKKTKQHSSDPALICAQCKRECVIAVGMQGDPPWFICSTCFREDLKPKQEQEDGERDKPQGV
jgi:hypothetical protein